MRCVAICPRQVECEYFEESNIEEGGKKLNFGGRERGRDHGVQYSILVWS